jgi:hypothetical protein
VLKGYLHIFETPDGQFTKLKSIELHMPTVETINWFFENCPCLEEAKVFYTYIFKFIIDPHLKVLDSTNFVF